MEEESYLKRQRFYKTIMLIIVTVFITFIVTTLYITDKYNFTGEDISALINANSSGDNLSKSINYIKVLLDKYYLKDIDEEKAKEGAIQGYVASLGDPYTQYIPKDEMEDYTVNLMGNYVGIGVYIAANTEKDVIQVLMPIKGGPAEEAGILPGDIITAIDGVKYAGSEIDVAADKMKGEQSTTVKIEILRDEETKTFEITRRKVITNPVESKKLENNIGYIQVTSFDQETADGFKVEFENLKKQGITSLIIDLRNNGGGLVEEALEMLDYIVPKGKDVLITVNKNNKEKITKAEENVLIDMPIVVLVNGNSASASEIFAGALKDLNEATIVGTKTYGKGVIQQLLTLRDGSGLKITVEEYYTPNRNKIHDIGIEPNIIVQLPETVISPLYVKENEDTQLQKAIEILK